MPWEVLPQLFPYPFDGLAQERDPFPAREVPGILDDLLTHTSGLAGVLAAAAQCEDVAVQDIAAALVVLKGYTNACVVLWQFMQAQRETEAPGAGDETPLSPPCAQGRPERLSPN